MASQRQLKQKIHAVRNIRQITRAMQMVAATKMRKSQEIALRARPYATHSLQLLSHIMQAVSLDVLREIALAQAVDSNTICIVVVTSDKGLAGTYNGAVLRLAAEQVASYKDKGKKIEVVAVGKKAMIFFTARNIKVAVSFNRFSDITDSQDAAPLAAWLINAYERRAYKKIIICSTQFVSALLQIPQALQLMPLDINALQQIVNNIIPKTGKYADWAKTNKEEEIEGEYKLEPSAIKVAQDIVRALVQAAVTHLLFESNAAEHSARMLAMKNATENADSMQQKLTLALNKARQASITQEIAEISTAKEVLS